MSFVCSGKEQGTWDHSVYNGDVKGLNMIEEDEMQFRSIVSIKLRPKGVNANKFATNTPKTEASHRTYTMGNPQQATHLWNIPSRIHYAVHLINHELAKLAQLYSRTQPVRGLQQYENNRNIANIFT